MDDLQSEAVRLSDYLSAVINDTDDRISRLRSRQPQQSSTPTGDGATSPSSAQAGGGSLFPNPNPIPRFMVEAKPNIPKPSYFSGEKPLAKIEVDFVTWRYQAKELVSDDRFSEAEKRQALVGSLRGQALNAVHQQGVKRPGDVIKLLSDLYGNVLDDTDLYRKFLVMEQEDESPRHFLERLHNTLILIRESGAIDNNDIPRLLLSQFVRKCKDFSFIQRLRLDEMEQEGKYLPYPQLVIKVRRAEEIYGVKSLVPEVPTVPAVQAAHTVDALKVESDKKFKELQPKLDDLQLMMVNQMAQPAVSAPPPHTPVVSPAVPSVFRGFCYNCGTDGHRQDTCELPTDAVRVQQRLLLRSNQQRQGRGYRGQGYQGQGRFGGQGRGQGRFGGQGRGGNLNH